MPVLFAYREDRFGFQFEFQENALFGRSPECNLILFDRATSRKHAEITNSEDGYILEDLGSTNGTFHNEVQVDGRVVLNRNDLIRVGQEVFLFDPMLDVAVGPDGAVLIVGDLEAVRDGWLVGPVEYDITRLDRPCLAPLFQVATAMAARPERSRVLKQAAYAISKLFGATNLALLWPESADSKRLTALLARSSGERLALSEALVDLVLKDNQSVIWPEAITRLEFDNGRRILEVARRSTMAIPLKALGDRWGLLYVESESKDYGERDLNFLSALGGIIAAALVNSGLIEQLDIRLDRDERWILAGGDFIGDDHQIKSLLGTASQIGQTDSHVLLTGEIGTGKEVLARRIHSQSSRRRGPFVSINCSVLPAGQVESTLFGQDAGAMSEVEVPGLLEQADGGTVFIRHVDHLSLSAQAELLRTIEERVAYRVGASTPRPIDFRTIASSAVDLFQLVQAGEFREDLYHRMTQVVLTMPPLREIRDDIPRLARHFLSLAAQEKGITVPELDPAVEDCLRAYHWPGNVGELQNVCHRLVMFVGGGRIVLDDLTPDIRYAPDAFTSLEGEFVSPTLSEVERILIRRALARSGKDVARASQILQISPAALDERIKLYEISLD